jgi:hypothetical protein
MAALPTLDQATGVGKHKFAPASSFLELCEYNPQEQSLDITFKSGSKRRYVNVSPVAFQSFQTAPDHSSFYSRALKGRFVSVPLQAHPVGRVKKQALKTPKVLNAGMSDHGLIPAGLAR